MMNTNPSEKVITFVESGILSGKLHENDRLPAERQLAQTLNISRASVREGIRLLEVFGLVECRRGSGNYIAHHSEETLKQVLSIVYTLDNLRYEEILEFRYIIERIALALTIKKAKQSEKIMIQKHLDELLCAKTQKEWAEYDRTFHLALVRMSGNQLLNANYAALNHVLDRCLWRTDQITTDQNYKLVEKLQASHRKLAEAVCTGDLKLGMRAIDQHFNCLTQHSQKRQKAVSISANTHDYIH